MFFRKMIDKINNNAREIEKIQKELVNLKKGCSRAYEPPLIKPRSKSNKIKPIKPCDITK